MKLTKRKWEALLTAQCERFQRLLASGSMETASGCRAYAEECARSDRFHRGKFVVHYNDDGPPVPWSVVGIAWQVEAYYR